MQKALASAFPDASYQVGMVVPGEQICQAFCALISAEQQARLDELLLKVPFEEIPYETILVLRRQAREHILLPVFGYDADLSDLHSLIFAQRLGNSVPALVGGQLSNFCVWDKPFTTSF